MKHEYYYPGDPLSEASASLPLSDEASRTIYNLNNLRMGQYNVGPEGEEQGRQLDEIQARHNAFLADTEASIEDAVRGNDHKVTSSPLAYRELSSPFSIDRSQNVELPLGQMGLPAVTPAIQKQCTPVALIIQRKGASEAVQDDAKVTTIRLVAVGDDGKAENFVLENLAVASDEAVSGQDAPPDMRPRWVTAKESIFNANTSTLTINAQLVPAVDANSPQHLVKLECDSGLEVKRTEVTIVRSPLTEIETASLHAEIKDEKVAPKSKRIGRAAQVTGALLAASGILLATTAESTDHAPLAISEIVGDKAKSEVDGIPQAEAHFDERTLSRARQAFDAYKDGDSAALAKQMELYNYKPEWIDPEAMKAVQEADSYDKLAWVSNQIFEKAHMPITLDVIDTPADVQVANHYGDYRHTPVKQLSDAKQATQAILETINTLNEGTLRNSRGRLNFLVTGDIRDKVPDKKGEYQTHGGYHYLEAQGIVVNTTIAVSASPDLDFMRSTVAHEAGHRFANKELDDAMSTLRKSDSYVGEDYPASSTVVNGVELTSEPYGNSNPHEAEAVEAQRIIGVLAQAPDAVFKHESVATEVASAMLFTMEDASPGFTASYLKRALQTVKGRGIRAADKPVLSQQELGILLGASGAILAGIASFLSFGRRRKV